MSHLWNVRNIWSSIVVKNIIIWLKTFRYRCCWFQFIINHNTTYLLHKFGSQFNLCLSNSYSKFNIWPQRAYHIQQVDHNYWQNQFEIYQWLAAIIHLLIFIDFKLCVMSKVECYQTLHDKKMHTYFKISLLKSARYSVPISWKMMQIEHCSYAYYISKL